MLDAFGMSPSRAAITGGESQFAAFGVATYAATAQLSGSNDALGSAVVETVVTVIPAQPAQYLMVGWPETTMGVRSIVRVSGVSPKDSTISRLQIELNRTVASKNCP